MATERVTLTLVDGDQTQHYHLPGADNYEATKKALEGVRFEPVEWVNEVDDPMVTDGDHYWRLPGKDHGDIVTALTAAGFVLFDCIGALLDEQEGGAGDP